MIFGMTTFTFVHVVISLVGIASGLVVLFGLLTGKWLDGWTALFSAGHRGDQPDRFGFPFDHLLPSHVVGIISLVVLAGAAAARYGFHLAGRGGGLRGGRRVSLYLNVFVLIVQLS